jgi:hypothetical protein
MQSDYYKNSKLDFGMYKGYELGIVYVFDPPYIEWCIKNIDRFYVADLADLNMLNVINTEIALEVKLTGDSSLIPFIDVFETFQDLLDNVDLTKEYHISEESIILNNAKYILKKRPDSRVNELTDEQLEYEDYQNGLKDEAGDFGDDDEYALHSWEEMDAASYEACPACGAIGEYNCCNYSIERNCG